MMICCRNLGRLTLQDWHFGVETASEELMKMINKKETVQDIVNGINLAKKYNFQ